MPWFGIFDAEITTTATQGVYVVYLFSAKMDLVYLSLGQGVTIVKQEFGHRTEDELVRRGSLLRDRVLEHKTQFEAGPIDLMGHTLLAKDYGPAVAFHKPYETNALPTNAQLVSDLMLMVQLYRLAITRGGTDTLTTSADIPENLDDTDPNDILERRRYHRHQKIERNSKASKAAKRELGYICQGCAFDCERIYGERGKELIEAHHLIPLHTLKEGETVSMNPKKDFAVLCSNCHRIVHRHRPMLTVDQLQKLKGMKALRRALTARSK